MSTPDVASWGRRAMLPKLERIRFTLPIVGYDMERLELQSFYELGGHIANLENLTRLPRNAKWNAATINAIAAALTGVVESDALTLLADASRDLLQTLGVLLDDCAPWEDTCNSPNGDTLTKIRGQIATFKSLLLPQWKRIHAYRVTARGLLDPAALIERPQDAFSDDQWGHVEKVAHADWASACRCLAFDLPTASGFHALRCFEAVALSYIDKLKVPRPSNRSLGAYLDLLKQNGATADKIDAAQKFRTLYRNPLVHPDESLTLREALNLLNLCGAMIQSLLDDMQSKGLLDPPTPTPAP